MIRCSRPLTTYPARAKRSNTPFWAICVAGDEDAWCMGSAIAVQTTRRRARFVIVLLANIEPRRRRNRIPHNQRGPLLATTARARTDGARDLPPGNRLPQNMITPLSHHRRVSHGRRTPPRAMVNCGATRKIGSAGLDNFSRGVERQPSWDSQPVRYGVSRPPLSSQSSNSRRTHR